MWGQEILKNLGYATAGIIPTRVGTRLRLFNLNNIKQDHPHACGDKRFTIFSVNSETGSSPRVWGQVLFFFVLLFTCGIIPTRVGTRVRNKLKTTADGDHPHACGDKYDLKAKIWNEAGSSPRVWGQVFFHLNFRNKSRIIPTRVGTRKNHHTVLPQKRDHPHACGDKPWLAPNVTTNTGSSPRVWGQAIEINFDEDGNRIIPTRVGTSCSRYCTGSLFKDHPHACGDKTF